MTAFAAAAPGLATARESWHIRIIRAALYCVSLTLYALPLASWPGILAATGTALPGLWLAAGAHRRGLRLPVVLVLTPPALLLSLLAGRALVDSPLIAGALGIEGTLLTAEVLSFGLGALVIAFGLRFLSLAARSLSLLEVLFVAGAAVTVLADHRNRMINRPRAFSDWAWTLGIDPTTVLMAIGITATVAAILLFLRGQRLLKVLITLALLLLLGALFLIYGGRRIKAETPPDALGLSGKSTSEQGGGKSGGAGGKGGTGGTGDGKGGGSSGGQSDNPFKDSYSSSSPPSPVAIAILRDDFETSTPILYFRQTALSLYNGHHLVSGTDRGWDGDVVARFPREGPIEARGSQSAANHIDVPTTMYLLVDHPQPVALTHATRIEPVKNPNPQQFVAAYDVRSRVLSVQPHRLLGRRSIPATWTAAQRAHYTELPDDPRYEELANIVSRDVDPRFFSDDLARAFAIKRHLEREGFYTMKSSHSSRQDPTASFLFGSLRGYCVHFAHAAVYLLRSQGIAARVALGYAVQINKRSGGSAILIMSDRAHAWPELHLDGIGWVTFDIYPERTDMQPPAPVDYDLEKLLGELARNDRTAGVSPDQTPLTIPWAALLLGAALLSGALVLLAYLIKIYRRLAPRLLPARARPRLVYVAVLDLLADLGLARRPGETRERHAARLDALCPAMEPLTRAHLAAALGGRPVEAAGFERLATRVRAEVRQNVHPVRRIAGLLNPIGWLWTR